MPGRRASRIPGISGKKIPGSSGRIPGGQKVGNHLTHVPRMPTSSQFREYHRQQVRDRVGRFAGGWGFAWQGLEALNERLYEWHGRNQQNLRRAVDQLAADMVSYMQSNAEWQDHPGVHQDARENLQAVVAWQDDTHFSIWLGHGAEVYYGIWLEVRWGGRYAIVLPTAQHFGPQLGARIKAVT